MSIPRPHSPSSAMLEPPRKSVELEDPGARELESSEGEDEHFSDASEGQLGTNLRSGRNSPIPITRVEKVDDTPSHGEVPGTPAYELRKQDAVPDEVDFVKGGISSNRTSLSISDIPITPGGTPIPKTVVEKIDPLTPSLGEVPGTLAYTIRQADAAPDVIVKAPEPGKRGAPLQFQPDNASPSSPIPKTIVSRADTDPAHGEVEGTEAFEIRKADASPDSEEVIGDAPGSPTSSLDRSAHRSHVRRKEYLNPQFEGEEDSDEIQENTTGTAVGDDFDDFEEGGDDDGFGDFDEGFQEPTAIEQQRTPAVTEPSPSLNPSLHSFPLLDFFEISTLPELLEASKAHLDFLYPSTVDLHSQDPPPPIEDSKAIFTSERSLSLWTQLVTPPPLQPPNWIKSRIRRLFLVSLGVPIDLDEILPASKQKKLILPSINLDGGRPSSDAARNPNTVGSIARLKQGADNPNASTGSLDSAASASRPNRSRRRGPPPPPELDMSAVHRLCSTTDEAMDGFSDEELKAHVKKLDEMTEKASEVLEYWLRMRDGKKGDKEAFEGVIENLVRHAKRVRK